jgi:PAS domain S-box-containing protein
MRGIEGVSGLSIEEVVSELEAFYELCTDLVAVSTADGKFRRVNRAWEKALGHKVDEIAGKAWLDFVHPDDVAKTIAAARSMSASDLAEFVNRYRHKNGTWVSLSWRATAWSGGLTYSVARVVA